MELSINNTLQFNNIRMVMLNGELLLVAKDVCDMLNIRHSKLLPSLSKEHKGKCDLERDEPAKTLPQTLHHKEDEPPEAIEKGHLLSTYGASVNLGQKEIFQILRDNKVLMANGKQRNQPFSRYIKRGFFFLQPNKYLKSNGEFGYSYTTMITSKGIDWLSHRLLEHGYLKVTAV